MNDYVFGVDIGGTTIKIGLFAIEGNLIEAWEIPTRKEENGKNILSDIAQLIVTQMDNMLIDSDSVLGIGLGVPGPVLRDGTVLRCVNLGWDVFNVEEALRDLTNLTVRAANNANLAALGEMWQGAGKGSKDLIMVKLGDGTGSGVIINKKILTGALGSAGEIGHMHVMDGEEEACRCGQHGCLEQYASANGLIRMTKRYLSAHPDVKTSLRDIENMTSKDICEAAAAGDETAAKLVDEMGHTLGKALASVACIVNPQVIILGGGVSNAGATIMEPVVRHFKPYAFHACRDTEFKLASLGDRAGMYGSAKLVLERL